MFVQKTNRATLFHYDECKDEKVNRFQYKHQRRLMVMDEEEDQLLILPPLTKSRTKSYHSNRDLHRKVFKMSGQLARKAENKLRNRLKSSKRKLPVRTAEKILIAKDQAKIYGIDPLLQHPKAVTTLLHQQAITLQLLEHKDVETGQASVVENRILAIPTVTTNITRKKAYIIGKMNNPTERRSNSSMLKFPGKANLQMKKSP